MQQGGFAQSRRTNPAGAALVFILHAGVLGAIILTPPDTFRHVIFDPLTTYNVPLAPPPPLPDQQPQPERQSHVTKIDAIVPTTGGNAAAPLWTDPMPPDPLPLPPVPQALPDPQPTPVLVEARPDLRFASALQPPYPSALARQEIEGKVVIRVLIGVDGRVKAVEPVSATDPAFQEATATQALKRWRFKPATKDGIPVESWRTMTVRFELKA